MTAETNDLANSNQVRRSNPITRSQRLPIPTETERDRIERVTTLHDILSTGHGLALLNRRAAIIPVNDLHASWWRAGTAAQ
ncbi:hypothetical protein D9M68_923970 [compost metagenome]